MRIQMSGIRSYGNRPVSGTSFGGTQSSPTKNSIRDGYLNSTIHTPLERNMNIKYQSIRQNDNAHLDSSKKSPNRVSGGFNYASQALKSAGKSFREQINNRMSNNGYEQQLNLPTYDGDNGEDDFDKLEERDLDL